MVTETKYIVSELLNSDRTKIFIESFATEKEAFIFIKNLSKGRYVIDQQIIYVV